MCEGWSLPAFHRVIHNQLLMTDNTCTRVYRPVSILGTAGEKWWLMFFLLHLTPAWHVYTFIVQCVGGISQTFGRLHGTVAHHDEQAIYTDYPRVKHACTHVNCTRGHTHTHTHTSVPRIGAGMFRYACLCFTMELVGECLKCLFELMWGVTSLVVQLKARWVCIPKVQARIPSRGTGIFPSSRQLDRSSFSDTHTHTHTHTYIQTSKVKRFQMSQRRCPNQAPATTRQH